MNVYIWHAWHNRGLCVLTPKEYEARIAEVLREKPGDELDLRLHYLGMAWTLPPKARAEWAEWDKARAEWDKARAEWDKAWAEREKARAEWEKAMAEWDKARAEWDKARAEREKALAEWDRKWHAKLCHPSCKWTPENSDIFAAGKGLEVLL
jgi:hypothetical protein